MPKPIRCTLFIHSTGIHVQQIYTGFKMLDHQGVISLRVVPDKNRTEQDRKKGYRSAFHRFLMAQVGDVPACYDLDDGAEILTQPLDESDFYFKRGYTLDTVSALGDAARKVYPLGFNYQVQLDTIDSLGLITSFQVNSIKQSLRESKNYFPFLDFSGFVPRVHNTHSAPDVNQSPKALYLARLWDPYDLPGRSESSVHDRIAVNEARITSITRLKRELKSNFTGGLVSTSYAEKICPDLVVRNKSFTELAGYLELVQQHAICVSTLGLLKSNPWKLAHYIAFSRSIVTEPLYYHVPGNFERGRHYLEFKKEEEMVDQVLRLFDDKHLRETMMISNWQYYQDFLSPDKLVLNTLNQIFSGKKTNLQV